MDWRTKKRIKQDAQWFLEDLGQQIRDVRERRRQTRETIAKRVGISSAALQNLEIGKPVLMETFLAVLQAMNLQVKIKARGKWKVDDDV